jgi:hypothetical protein
MGSGDQLLESMQGVTQGSRSGAVGGPDTMIDLAATELREAVDLLVSDDPVDGEELLDGEELIDAAEAARRLGMRNARAVLVLRVHRFGFPPPVCRQGRVLLWSWTQVDLWNQETGAASARSSLTH